MATGSQRELDGVNLFDLACPVEVVITVRGAEGGWDCCFAYVFCSLRKIGSKPRHGAVARRVLHALCAKPQERAAQPRLRPTNSRKHGWQRTGRPAGGDGLRGTGGGAGVFPVSRHPMPFDDHYRRELGCRLAVLWRWRLGRTVRGFAAWLARKAVLSTDEGRWRAAVTLFAPPDAGIARSW